MGFFRSAIWMILIAVLSIFLSYFAHEPEPPFIYGGRVEPGYEEVGKVFKQNFETGFESDGAAFAVCRNGKMVVDIWGGYADKSSLRPWREDTLSTAFSCTKGVAALCIAQLVDRGYLKYDDLVTKHWPEFGSNGKSNVTVKMLLGHEAGLALIDEPITKEAVRNWPLMSKLFENQKPNWPPGSTAGYHVITFGFLCDQLIRRTDPKHRGIGQYFKEEIAEPFGIDFYIGLPRDQLHRVARMTMATVWDYIKRFDDWNFVKFLIKIAGRHGHQFSQSTMRNPDWLHMLSQKYMAWNDPDIKDLEIAGGGGIGTARALARLYCLLGDEKSSFLSKTVVDTISKPVRNVPEEAVLGINLTFGHGFLHTISPNGQYHFGHPGYGGQNAKFDPQENLAYAYLRNNMSPEFVGELVRTFRYLERATFKAVRDLKK